MIPYIAVCRWPNSAITYTIQSTTYDARDMRKAWLSDGQGHDYAVARGRWCIVLPCDLGLACKLAREFCEDFFNIPTCTHYDGKTLSLYCGDAGGNAAAMMARVYLHLKERQYDGIQCEIPNLSAAS